MIGDERRAPQRSTSPGWVATAGGALFLIALGFSVGLVAGTAYQEPQLVADHLAGRTTDVVLDGEETVPATPDVAAPAPDAAPAEAPAAALGEGALDTELDQAATPDAELTTAPPPQEAKRGVGEGFSIQVGAFGNEKAARQLAGELGKHGYTTFLTDEGEGARFKVRVGPLGSRAEAERLSERLKREQRLPTWILAGGAAQQPAQ